jgi:hypothetical protein
MNEKQTNGQISLSPNLLSLLLTMTLQGYRQAVLVFTLCPFHGTVWHSLNAYFY